MANDPVFQCEICKKIFNNKNSLKSHKSRTHSDKRPMRYSCTLCKCSYSRNHDLKRHIELKHEGAASGVDDSQDSKTPRKEQAYTSTSPPPSKKGRTSEPGPSKETEYSDQDIFCCDCGDGFTHYPSYIKHRKTKHQTGLGEREKRTEKYYTFADGTVDEGLKRIYQEKYHHIMVPHRFSQVISYKYSCLSMFRFNDFLTNW